MNRRMVLNTVGHIILAEAALLLLPAIVSVIYMEKCLWAFLITIGIALSLGLLLKFTTKPDSKVIYAKEGFVIVTYAWLLMSAIGALPFVISGEIPHFIDAFFETVSGFTTTGASILTDVESMSHGILFWRSFTHWIGGMGVIVFVMAIIPNITDRSMNIMKAEVPGPTVGKLVPKARDTAKILYLIYIALTLVMIVMLLFGGMPLFDSIVHTFGTAGTGGFGIKSTSIGGYTPYCQWVITVFMLVFSVNFNIYYLVLLGKFKSVLKSTELWFFIGLVIISIAVITTNIRVSYTTFEETLRYSSFQVATIISTTGYATTNFNTWPGLSKAILFMLMFIGGCAGSTAGGLKNARVVMLLKTIHRELKRMVHPRSVRAISMEDKRVDEQTLSGVTSYFAIYAICIMGIFVIISFEPFGIETNLSATVACFNNVGPGFGAVGPNGSYAEYTYFTKVVLSLAMLLGRLEIFPLILGINPTLWKKR
ncbi:MAG: TrkH family potassium uptake protein [Clostridia bacterium]|nr:TrkH family potassium uptake protein [Clostridia bacterium]